MEPTTTSPNHRAEPVIDKPLHRRDDPGRPGPSRTVVVTQSNYIPWKGYFDQLNLADEVVLYDDVQFTRRDWRNRNRIKTPQGLLWLTIPVKVKGRFEQRIDETIISDPSWRRQHWKSLRYNYGRAPHFETYEAFLEDLYLSCDETNLSAINRRFLEGICELLGIRTSLRSSSEFDPAGDRTQRLVRICVELGASTYLSGPSARDYLDEEAFRAEGIEVAWMDYSGYPEYPQLHGPFEHSVSVLDLLFMTGPDAPHYMKSFA